jgi:four helix bundle protein
MQQFDHVKLDVHQSARQLIARSAYLLNELPRGKSVQNQLDRFSTSMPLNLAEENGKYPSEDRCRYFDNSRRSAIEFAASVNVLVAKRLATEDGVKLGKKMLVDLVSKIIGLIRANSQPRSV